VNVHHFILDGAIWKLRDTRVGRVLLASNDDPGGAAEPARAAPAWRPPLAWAAGAAIVVLTIVGAWEKAALARAGSSGDEARADVARARLAAIGRDHPQYRVIAADRLARAGDLDSASREFEASLGLHPTAPGFVGLGLVYELQGSSREALLAYRAALELDPDEPRALHRVGVHLLELGHPGKAEAVLSRAAELLPSDETIRADLARAAASRADPS
jgi:Flp pilus assembly protein TadD